MSAKITEYTMVCSDEVVELSKMVGWHFQRGWKLYGTPFACGEYICQAMVKMYDKKKEAGNGSN